MFQGCYMHKCSSILITPFCHIYYYPHFTSKRKTETKPKLQRKTKVIPGDRNEEIGKGNTGLLMLKLVYIMFW